MSKWVSWGKLSMELYDYIYMNEFTQSYHVCLMFGKLVNLELMIFEHPTDLILRAQKGRQALLLGCGQPSIWGSKIPQTLVSPSKLLFWECTLWANHGQTHAHCPQKGVVCTSMEPWDYQVAVGDEGIWGSALVLLKLCDAVVFLFHLLMRSGGDRFSCSNVLLYFNISSTHRLLTCCGFLIFTSNYRL